MSEQEVRHGSRGKFDLLFYGTGAAEAIPNPFCQCFLCNHAREKGGKDVRTRTMFRINERVLVDLGADALTQAMKYGDLIGLEHVLFTHTHEDHFASMMMSVRKMATHRTDKPLHYYLTDKAYELVGLYRDNPIISKGAVRQMEKDGVIEFHKQEFGVPFYVDGMKVIAFRGNHFGNLDENTANYLIYLKNGKTLFYGLDTGYYLEETFGQLRDYHIDYYISECTYGNSVDPGPGHLYLSLCLEVFDRLLKQGTIDEKTEIYLTHINHCHTANHDMLQRLADESGFPAAITVTYDGFQI